MSQMQKRLKIIWGNDHALHRYVPRSLVGGTGWGVWDRKSQRFLKDGEVKKLAIAACTETFAA